MDEHGNHACNSSQVKPKMIQQGRKILLLLDNVSSHSPYLKDSFSNITVAFLPKNTTSRLLPLDFGIINNFKVYYRKLLVRHTFAAINDSDDNASRYANRSMSYSLFDGLNKPGKK